MKKQKRKGKIEFSDEIRLKYINEIVDFFETERGEKIGVVAAGELLDFFLQVFGEEVYKKAVKDCRKLFEERFEDIKTELDIL